MVTAVLDVMPVRGIRMDGRPTAGSGLFGICQALPTWGSRPALVVNNTRSTRAPSSRIHKWNVCAPTAPETAGRASPVRLVVHDQRPYWPLTSVMAEAVLVAPSRPAWTESSVLVVA